MNTYLLDAANDFFEKCTPAQKQAAFSLMVSSVAKYKIKPSFFGGTELPNRTTTDELLKWFSACSKKDKVEVIMLVISLWADEFKYDHEACKTDPGHLDRVTVETLQNIAMQEQELAHQQIIQAFPDSVEMLLDFETLAAFGTSSDSPSPETLDAVKSSLSRVWSRAGNWNHQQAAAPGSVVISPENEEKIRELYKAYIQRNEKPQIGEIAVAVYGVSGGHAYNEVLRVISSIEAGKAAPVSRVTEAKKAANAEVVQIIKKAVRISKGSEAQNG